MNINHVVITGNLTRDPELRHTPSGTPVCSLRVAVNGRIKRDGEWMDKPNFFNVTVWGNMGETTSRYLSRGRPVAIDGRLDWHEWDGDSGHREAVEIVAEKVQFLGTGRGDDDTSVGDYYVPRDEGQYVPQGEDDDIPFDPPPDDDFPF